MSWQKAYLEKYYSGTPGWIDGTTEFHRICASAIPSGSSILEVGSGPENATSWFLSTLGPLTGVDVGSEIFENGALDAACMVNGERYPFGDGTFDACVSNYVIEHIADPARHLREVKRVLKPNGVYVFRTPNRYHYTAIASRFTPHFFHRLVANRLRNLPPGSHDPWPTFYRLNSGFKIARTARAVGLEIDAMRLIEKEPSYGLSSRVFFLAFMLYERATNASHLLADLRANILGVLRKPA